MDRRIVLLIGLGMGLVGLGGPRRASAQAMLADDIVILSKGKRQQEKARTESHLGPVPGSGVTPFPFRPGRGEPARLAERPGPGATAFPAAMRATQPFTRGPTGILSAASGYASGERRQAEPPKIPVNLPLPGRKPALYGALELPGREDEGPADGLTLDLAIDRLIQVNPDLATKFQEIPKARADVLSAGLRANPMVFASADNVPYGSYSPQRPGNNGYSVVLIQPIDVNHKRKARMLVAEQARMVLEAQYQDAIRQAIDGLSTAFVDVLDARDLVRYRRASVARLDDVTRTVQEQVRKGIQPESRVDEVMIQRDTAEVELDSATAALAEARRNLATLLNVPAAEAESVEVRGTIRDQTAPPPPLEDLIRLALAIRPDVVAYRLGVHRAEADVKLARAERFEDVFLLYTPYQFTNYAPVNEQSATGWSIGVLVSLPFINRNQGNIARARHTVHQSQIELNGLERQVVNEVQRGWQDYETTHRAVQRLEQNILPRARHLRDDKYRLYTEGQEDITVYYTAERNYNDVIRLYRDTLIRHRRSMLRLNTVVGQRILP